MNNFDVKYHEYGERHDIGVNFRSNRKLRELSIGTMTLDLG